MKQEIRYLDRDFDWIRTTIKSKTGINLGEEKRDLVYNRLARRVRGYGLADFSAYIDYVTKNPAEEMESLINAITTNVTAFYREPHHFEQLTRFIRTIPANHRGGRKLRVWSAGCSSGMEPYTIAITIQEATRGQKGWDAKILATDLDTEILRKAAAGEYRDNAVKDVDKPLRSRYFVDGKAANQGRSKVTPELRNLITFKRLNLMSQWPMKHPFDVIFCRNVMIYFDKPTQASLLERFVDRLAVGGLLCIGHSESIPPSMDRLESLGKTAFRKVK
ncbi:MAG: protein-glutamate O-methyltransferase CheR [Deltaproteobacteria bacterium]|jgi:chemotaxis protein methyltransferase CheR